MLGLGSGFAVVLLIASIKLKVEIDPKIEQIHEALFQFAGGFVRESECQNTLWFGTDLGNQIRHACDQGSRLACSGASQYEHRP